MTRHIIPNPVRVSPADGARSTASGMRIRCDDPSLRECAAYLEGKLARAGIDVGGKESAGDDGRLPVRLEIAAAGGGDPGGEGYRLDVNDEGVSIRAAAPAGVFYGIQTLRHLLAEGSAGTLGHVSITDRPRYPWRGLMLDESRHFFGKEKVKQYLELMAFYKLNRFHWHLTDSPAWRLEIRAYPKLAGVGGSGSYSDRDAPVAFYTQDDIREIVEYARVRHIEIVPEIDMPGHANAANRAYPEFSGGKVERLAHFTFNPASEATDRYLEAVLAEAAELFPAPWLHYGGDEVSYGSACWADNPDVRQLMEREGFDSLIEVERRFNVRMAEFIHGLGKTVVGWDEIVEAGVDPSDAVITWWRHDLFDTLTQAAEKGYGLVLCPRIPLYFDFIQHPDHSHGRWWGRRRGDERDAVLEAGRAGDHCHLGRVYDGPILPDEIWEAAGERVLGIQANLWTEMIHTPERLDFMTVPRLAALAESAWTCEDRLDYPGFEERLRAHLPIYDERGISYFNPFDPNSTPEVPGPTGPAATLDE